MGLIYLGALLISISCMALLDRRFRLVMWRAPRSGSLTIGAGIVVFLSWDLAAIAWGHYGKGQGPMTGIVLAPELPVEEIVFITFLCYLTLVLRGLIGAALSCEETPPAGAPR